MGQQYLASMLGAKANWVLNVRANRMLAVMHHGRHEQVTLVELKTDPRAAAPILKRYLKCAPGARPHMAVDYRAPVADFEPYVGQHPLFRVDFPPH